MLILGVDTGGTFTDFVLQSEGELKTYKLPSTPDDPSRAILQGLDHFFGQQLPQELEIIHGSTVATNAFLERKGARTLLVTTRGFEDILFIGRQNRPKLYDFNITRPPEIIPRSLIVGVQERMFFDGTVLRPLGKSVGRRLRSICRKKKVASVAACNQCHLACKLKHKISPLLKLHAVPCEDVFADYIQDLHKTFENNPFLSACYLFF